jgi:hypothetical protein
MPRTRGTISDSDNEAPEKISYKNQEKFGETPVPPNLGCGSSDRVST